MKHYPRGGSKAARDLGCAAWPHLSRDLAEVPVGEPALYGTAVHRLCELGLHPPLGEHVGETCPESGLVIDADMVKLSVQLRRALYDVLIDHGHPIDPDTARPEVTSEYIPESAALDGQVGSTVDVLSINPDTKHIILADYKTGRVQVEAENNAQLLHNAMCVVFPCPAEDEILDIHLYTFTGVIIQPDAAGNVVAKQWSFNYAQLDKFEQRYIDAITQPPGTAPTMGPHCTYCPAAAVCPAKLGLARHALALRPSEDMAEAVTMIKDLRAWCTTVEAAAVAHLTGGGLVPGYKLVAKRAMEKWVNPPEALQFLRDMDLSPPVKLATPAQVRKAIGADNVPEDLTSKKSSGNTVAPESDKRDPVLGPALQAALDAIQ
jgi:hypothetical protein